MPGIGEFNDALLPSLYWGMVASNLNMIIVTENAVDISWLYIARTYTK